MGTLQQQQQFDVYVPDTRECSETFVSFARNRSEGISSKEVTMKRGHGITSPSMICNMLLEMYSG